MSRSSRREPSSGRRTEWIIIIGLLMIVAGEAGFILGREISRAPQTPDTAYTGGIAAGSGSTGPAYTEGGSAAGPFPAGASTVATADADSTHNNPGPGPAADAQPEPEADSGAGGEADGQEAAGRATAAYDLALRSLEPPLEDKDVFIDWTLRNRPEEEYYVSWRWDCAQDLLDWDSIQDERILKAFLLSPREKFIREQNIHLAYEHRYLPIGYGATITDPWVVSIMTQTINPELDHKVLEIGTGSGYQAAILSQLSNHVYTVEIIEELLDETDRIYREMEASYPEYANIKRKADDGYYGWQEHAPFDRIIVTCGIDHIPPDLLKQLAPDGIMVIPVGPPSGQTLMKVVKRVDRGGMVFFDREKIMSVKFIPFVTKEGDARVRGSR